jgi:transposase-like protein
LAESDLQAEAADIALSRLEEFEVEWSKRYPAIDQLWRWAWVHILRLLPGNQENDLHNQLRRVIEPLAAQDHQNPR